MEIVVIDGQGGGLGKQVIEAIKKNIPSSFIIGVGTNSIASSNMKRGGADAIATGENAIVFNANKAKVIVAPIGLAFANSMYGEVSTAMASAVSSSDAIKYLIPISKCHVTVVGVESLTINEYIEQLIRQLLKKAD